MPAADRPSNAAGHITVGPHALSCHQTIAGTTLHPATATDRTDSTETKYVGWPLPTLL